MWLRRIALALSLLAAALLALSGPGVRLGLWSFGAGLGMAGAALVVGLSGAAAALVGLVFPRLRGGSAPRLAFAFALGIAAALVPAEFIRRAKSVPSIHDITTDVEKPPQFVAVLPLRAGAPNPPGYAGPHIGELQGIAYPNLKPLVLKAPPAKVLEAALEAARALGWEVVGTDPGSGRVEAVATSLWFGFKDDVVVRIAPEGAGTRVDVRSKSRVGRSDLGANARRIEEFLTRLREKEYS